MTEMGYRSPIFIIQRESQNCSPGALYEECDRAEFVKTLGLPRFRIGQAPDFEYPLLLQVERFPRGHQ